MNNGIPLTLSCLGKLNSQFLVYAHILFGSRYLLAYAQTKSWQADQATSELVFQRVIVANPSAYPKSAQRQDYERLEC